MSMHKTNFAAEQLPSSVHIEKSYLGKAATRSWITGNLPLKVAGGTKTAVNGYRRQTVHQGKVDLGVSELPRGNKMPRDHVNSPNSALVVRRMVGKDGTGKGQRTSKGLLNKDE